MKHTECEDCKLRNGDCGHHFKMNGKTDYDIPSLSACDRYGDCEFFQQKEKPQGDLISRSVAINLLNEAQVEFDEYYKGLGKAKTIIDNAPTVEPICNQIAWEQGYEAGLAQGKSERTQGEWIPVEERLPEEMQTVLVWFEYYRYGDYNCMFPTYGFCYVCDGKWSRFINDKTGWTNANIIAWMPLPEPYSSEVNHEDS